MSDVDEADAAYDRAKRYWQGVLFEGFRSPIYWKNSKGYFDLLEPPQSVTFPICQLCSRLVWDWPHFDEPVPRNAACGPCVTRGRV